MRMHITLDLNTVDDVARRATQACHYWQAHADADERLPDPRKLRELLRKPLEVGPTWLRVIANDDQWSVDVLVQLAMFGDVRYG